ncbi:MAG TPA: hypothetical protein VKU44_06365 [Terriglobia bacterium]|nr:hypothetical protein [Terriglobia bacterium]
MRAQDAVIFSQAAVQLQLWIFVRLSNKASRPYMGLSDYVPKRIDCKAKTAHWDEGGKKLAGLVVDYRIHSGVFEPGKDAGKPWKDFEIASRPGMPGSPYQIDTNPSSKHYGCVTLNGKYIYSDYDLWDIVDPGNPRRNFGIVEDLHGQTHIRSHLQRRVEDWINPRLSAPMIQHSGEMQFNKVTDQPIDAFGPKGEVVILLTQLTWEAWCRDRFQGRRSIGDRIR